MMDPKVKEALEALASGNASLFACLWNQCREKTFAYYNGSKPKDDTAAEMLGRAVKRGKKNPLFRKTA